MSQEFSLARRQYPAYENNYRDSAYRKNIRGRLDMVMRLQSERMYCSSGFADSCLPPLLRKGADMLALTHRINRDAAAFMLVLALAAADRGLHRVAAGPQDEAMPLTLYGVLGLDASGDDGDAWYELKKVFLDHESGARRRMRSGKARAGGVGGPLLYNDLTHAACAFSLEKSGVYLALDPEDVEEAALGTELSRMLSACWQGRDLAIDRADAGSRVISRPFCQVLLRMPRASIDRLTRDESGATAGLACRSLFFVAPPEKTRRGASPTENAWKRVEELLQHLLEASDADDLGQRPEPVTLRLAPEAFRDWLQYRRLKNSPMESMPETFNRWRKHMAGHVLRIAGLFHLAGRGGDGDISRESLEMAASFLQVLEEHAHSVFTTHNLDRPYECAQTIISFLGRRNVPFCARPQIFRKMRIFGYEQYEIAAALGLLETARQAMSGFPEQDAKRHETA